MGIFTWWSHNSDPSSLYVDDVALILEHMDVLPKVRELIQFYGQFIGLELNISKTMAYVPHLAELIVVAGVRVSSEPVKYLGSFLCDQETVENLNFEKALAKMRSLGSKWRCRSLTLKV